MLSIQILLWWVILVKIEHGDYIYIIPLDDTTLMTKMIALDGEDGDVFGWSIAVSEGIL